MNRALNFIVLVCLFPLFFSFQPREKVVFKSVKIPDIVSVSIPENFQKLNDDQIADKLITSRKPLAMFSSPTGTTDFSVSLGNSARNPWQDNDLKMMADFQKSNIKSLFTSVNFIQEKMVKITGQEYALYEFLSEVKEKGKSPVKKYNYILYTIRKKNVFIFSFICPESERPVMEGTAAEIMNSIKF